ncbi:hypothetical protein V6N13_031403 [Hibiscus sabdariffa]|uniref:Uncharacterized protein n=1 Tax=Hibiscus sabdariffa TaxID=183260 RepID=A0ABR2CM76_9ROSI
MLADEAAKQKLVEGFMISNRPLYQTCFSFPLSSSPEAVSYTPTHMDPQDVIVFAAMAARMRQLNRRKKKLLRAAQVALLDKANKCEMLKRKKQSMLVKEAAMQKLVDDFMLFTEAKAIDKNDAKNALNFDEKAMMNTILTMMNDGRDYSINSGGFVTDDGKKQTNLSLP